MKTTSLGLVFLLIATLNGGEATTPSPAPADVVAAPADAQVTASGLASKVIEAGGARNIPASRTW